MENYLILVEKYIFSEKACSQIEHVNLTEEQAKKIISDTFDDLSTTVPFIYLHIGYDYESLTVEQGRMTTYYKILS